MPNQLLLKIIAPVVTIIVIAHCQITEYYIYDYTFESEKDAEPIEITTDREGTIYIQELITDNDSKIKTFNLQKVLESIDTNNKLSENGKENMKNRIKSVVEKIVDNNEKIKITDVTILKSEFQKKEDVENEDKILMKLIVNDNQEITIIKNNSTNENVEKGQYVEHTTRPQNNQEEKTVTPSSNNSKDTKEECNKLKDKNPSHDAGLQNSTETNEEGNRNDRIFKENNVTEEPGSTILNSTKSNDNFNNELGNSDHKKMDGFHAKLNQFPFHVKIYSKLRKRKLCSGAIVNVRIIITSARCVHNQKKRNVQIQVLSIVTTISYDVSAIIFYNKNNVKIDDIALIKTTEDIFNNSTNIDKLIFDFIDIPVGAEVTVTGLKCNENLLNLRYGRTEVVEKSRCEYYYPFVQNETYCSQVPSNGGGRKCFEEKGSPVVWNGNLVGIVSLSKKGQPSRYIRFPYYMNWLLTKAIQQVLFDE